MKGYSVHRAGLCYEWQRAAGSERAARASSRPDVTGAMTLRVGAVVMVTPDSTWHSFSNLAERKVGL